jgi:ATP-dependent Lon protease
MDANIVGSDDMKTKTLIAIARWKNGEANPPICFIGPDGVGKSLMATVVSDTWGVKLFKLNAATIEDEEELKVQFQVGCSFFLYFLHSKI